MNGILSEQKEMERKKSDEKMLKRWRWDSLEDDHEDEDRVAETFTIHINWLFENGGNRKFKLSEKHAILMSKEGWNLQVECKQLVNVMG